MFERREGLFTISKASLEIISRFQSPHIITYDSSLGEIVNSEYLPLFSSFLKIWGFYKQGYKCKGKSLIQLRSQEQTQTDKYTQTRPHAFPGVSMRQDDDNQRSQTAIHHNLRCLPAIGALQRHLQGDNCNEYALVMQRPLLLPSAVYANPNDSLQKKLK